LNSGLDSGICRLQLNSKGATPAASSKGAIDLCNASPLRDDEDALLQAALLASMTAPAYCAEPVPLSEPGVADATELNSSARMLQIIRLVLKPFATPLCA
jgi:hypothetical protein